MTYFPLSHTVRQRTAATPGSVLLEQSRARHGKGQSLLFSDPLEVVELTSAEDVLRFFPRLETALAEGKYVAGYLAYEAGYVFEPTLTSLLKENGRLGWFGIYDAPEIFHHNVEADQPQLPQPTASPQLSLTRETYASNIAVIRRLIEDGDTYQANLTMEARWSNDTDAATLFAQMMQSQPVEFGAFVNLGATKILSASPELFFARDGDAIVTRPMKGTVRRGRSLPEDDAATAWLRSDEKNRSENLMIVDLLRNDLGRICEHNSVNVPTLFEVERFSTVLQMTSTVAGTLRHDVGYLDLFRALFPSGSIIGAPKIRTAQILHGLEQRERGVYTGAIGYFAPSNHAVFSVAIRTAEMHSDEAVMGVGSGVVYDSEASSEYDECIAKTAFLSRPTRSFDLIETMLWDGGYRNLQPHLDRLRSSAHYFDFVYNDAAIQSSLREAERSFGCSDRLRVRLLLNRYGRISIETSPCARVQEEEISILLSDQHTDSADPFYFHKTTYRPLYETWLQRAREARCSDAIFLNERDEVTEGSIHNIYIVKDGRWLTSPVECGLLNGIARQEILRQHHAEQSRLMLEDLHSADAIYLCNDVRGLRRVKRLFGQSGPNIRLLRTL